MPNMMTDSNAGLVKPVRAVAFSPGGKLLAAAGDSKTIILYDTSSGEQVANLSGHSAWIMSLAWNHTGEHLLSGYVHDPVARVSPEALQLTASKGPLMAKLKSGLSTAGLASQLILKQRNPSGVSNGFQKRERQRDLRLPERIAAFPSIGRPLGADFYFYYFNGTTLESLMT